MRLIWPILIIFIIASVLAFVFIVGMSINGGM